MDHLDICKRIAEIEGATSLTTLSNGDYEAVGAKFEFGWVYGFNPVRGSDLNIQLRDKHECQINYVDKEVTIFKDKRYSIVKFDSKSDINRVVCECIIKAHR